MKRSFWRLSIFLALLVKPAYGEHIPPQVSEALAYKLLRTVVPPSEAGFDVGILGDSNDDDHPFLVYNALGLNGDTIGWWAVNIWTGDVWDIMSCKRADSPKLNERLLAIRKRYRPSELKDYERLRKLRPGSMVTDDDCELPKKQ